MKRILLLLVLLSACALAEKDRNACKDGEIRQGYSTSFPVPPQDCTKQTQTCLNGQWTGPQLFDHCEENMKSCDGHPHGSVQTGYTSMTASPGNPCTQSTRMCNNGTWSGPMLHPMCN